MLTINLFLDSSFLSFRPLLFNGPEGAGTHRGSAEKESGN
jgi:hypothetical protein